MLICAVILLGNQTTAGNVKTTMRASWTCWIAVGLVLGACGSAEQAQPSSTPDDVVSISVTAANAEPLEAPVTDQSTTSTSASTVAETTPPPDLPAVGDLNEVAPRGWEFELMTMARISTVQVRSGGSREVTVSATDVGSSPGVWTVDVQSNLREGVTVTGEPELLDFNTESPRFFTVVIDVPADSRVGVVGGFHIRMLPPEGGVSSAVAAARFGVDVLPPGSVVGPFVADDRVAGSPRGVVVDPLANDTAGDTELDRATLNIIGHAGPGEITITDDGQIRYVTADPAATDTAIYEICDTADRCAQAVFNGWSV